MFDIILCDRNLSNDNFTITLHQHNIYYFQYSSLWLARSKDKIKTTLFIHCWQYFTRSSADLKQIFSKTIRETPSIWHQRCLTLKVQTRSQFLPMAVNPARVWRPSSPISKALETPNYRSCRRCSANQRRPSRFSLSIRDWWDQPRLRRCSTRRWISTIPMFWLKCGYWQINKITMGRSRMFGYA